MARTEIGEPTPEASTQKTRSTYIAGAAAAACIALGGVLMLDQGEVENVAELEPIEESVEVVPDDTAPTDLAMTDEPSSCQPLLDAAAAIDAVEHIGPEAITAMQRLRDLVPADVQSHVDTIVTTYEALEAGHVEQLLDDAQVGATTAAGDAVASYLADTCDIEMGQK